MRDIQVQSEPCKGPARCAACCVYALVRCNHYRHYIIVILCASDLCSICIDCLSSVTDTSYLYISYKVIFASDECQHGALCLAVEHQSEDTFVAVSSPYTLQRHKLDHVLVLMAERYYSPDAGFCRLVAHAVSSTGFQEMLCQRIHGWRHIQSNQHRDRNANSLVVMHFLDFTPYRSVSTVLWRLQDTVEYRGLDLSRSPSCELCQSQTG